jgi:hypothetical protein
LLSHKRKAELVGLTLVKALRSGAALMMRTAAHDTASLNLTMKRLRLREAAAKAGASA